MKIAITGSNGQLGSDLVERLQREHEVISLTHTSMDLASPEVIERVLTDLQPAVILNAAAFHNVELCEQDKDMAYRINSVAPETMAAVANKLQARFIHFSTDYVFDGNAHHPYKETDPAHPLNVYGASKRKGEQLVLHAYPQALVMRVSGLYGHYPCRAKNGFNFVQLMLKLAREKGEVRVVTDEYVSPTSTANIAEQVDLLLQAPLSGIVHSTSEGGCSWYEFAQEIFHYTHTKVTLHKGQSSDFPAKVPRPKYTVLENERLKQHDLNRMLPWKDALHQYLDSMPKA